MSGLHQAMRGGGKGVIDRPVWVDDAQIVRAVSTGAFTAEASKAIGHCAGAAVTEASVAEVATILRTGTTRSGSQRDRAGDTRALCGDRILRAGENIAKRNNRGHRPHCGSHADQRQHDTATVNAQLMPRLQQSAEIRRCCIEEGRP